MVNGQRSKVRAGQFSLTLLSHSRGYRCVVISTEGSVVGRRGPGGRGLQIGLQCWVHTVTNLFPVNFGPASTAYHGAKQQVTEITVCSILSLLCSPRASSFAGTAAPRVNVLCIQCLRQQPGLPGHGHGQQLSRQAGTTA